MTTGPLTWVVGSGGLLGSSVAARIPGADLWRPAVPMRWSTPETATAVAAAAAAFLEAAGERPWQVAWCAGAAVTSADAASLAAESAVFDRAMTALSNARHPERGGLFLASTAGGVYAGSDGPPHDERSVPQPLAPYGHAKLALEQRATALRREVGLPVLVGRISNLYGPGQNLAKPQGLISQILKAHLLRRTISIYVPLDTVRDNLYVADAARLVTSGLDRLREESRSGPVAVTKILASQQGVTIGFLVAELNRVLKRKPRVVYGSSASSAYQVRDLRMRSVVWSELDEHPLVPLPVGILRTAQSMAQGLGAGHLR